ncbi:MAG: baseplate J/gp47 family protein [Candidatus Thermoplasmatota archaeon]|nr:baseplate J/gp47 family protein [Candidatus Thermoplasmatota archaeon]
MPNIVDEQFLRTIYTKEKFSDLYEAIKDQMQERFPQWSDRLPSNQGVVLIELFCGLADMMRFYQNVTAVESFPALARLRESLVRHAKWLGYVPKPAGAARTDLTFTKDNIALEAFIPRGTLVETANRSVAFSTVEDIAIPPGVLTGTVGGVNGTFVENETIGTSDGSKNQRYRLGRTPLVTMPAEDGSELPYVSVTVDGEEWKQVTSLAWAAEVAGGPGNAYKIEIEADDTAYVVFGDGLFGNVPPAEAQIKATYVIGGGPDGNVGPNTLTRLVGTLANIRAVTNKVAATGGSERESDEELRQNIPSNVITRGRAVTREDYRRLLEAFAEISKISVRHPSANVVEIYILPVGGGLASNELKERVADYLDNIRMITEDVRVLDPTTVPIDIAAQVWVQPGFDLTEVGEECERALRTDINNTEFARSIFPSDIYSILLRVPGVAKVDLDLMAKTGETGIGAVVTKENELIVEGNLAITTRKYNVS